LVVTPSEKYGRYGINAVVDDPPTTTYLYQTRLNEIYVRDNYEGFAMGDMEIKVRYNNYNPNTGQTSGWTTIGTYEMQPDVNFVLEKLFLNKTYNNCQFELKIIEVDDWFFGGDDDIVANNLWHHLYDVNLYTQHFELIDQNVTRISFIYPQKQLVRDFDNNNNPVRVQLVFKMQAVPTNN
jgi:hypothetical protein